jgi:hypothetical protein
MLSVKISGHSQGCQIFLGTTIQNGEKYTKTGGNIPNGHKIYQMAGAFTKWPQNVPTPSIARSSKSLPKLDFLV